jgi:hypothetical protein
MKLQACALSGLFALVLLVGVSAPASSTPFVDVKADWQVSLTSALPNGISLSCFGSAVGIPNGCSDSGLLNTTVNSSEHLSVSILSGIVVKNTTTQTIGGSLSFVTNFSAFNPGGAPIGLGIDDPATQDAMFSSSVSGEEVGDLHNCSIGFEGYSAPAGFFTPTTCGVNSPDSSSHNFSIDLASIAPGQSEQIPYQISISADFVIPEPASISILAIGLIGIAGLVRRKRTH